jgi:hypothetical protein
MEIIAVYSENHIKPINILCEQNTELLVIKVHTVTTGLERVKRTAGINAN